ncbi:DNA primase [Facilibium subflavum]|uniref:DNA primase n=1 Tax=Facilibium subflavum TaxID=2219058 RepID=UPI000E6500E0|nr:DNA primase [Facilibium subflavum]
MKGKIPNDFVRQLVASTDIVDVISKFVKLKKTGKNFMACCPFHHEKTPSFSVSPQKQIYHCFGCHASGDVITFLSTHETLSFVDAVEELANLRGLNVPYEQNSKDDAHQGAPVEKIYAALVTASRYFRFSLKNDANSDVVIDYIKSRGLSGQTAKFFGLGYAPNQWQGLYSVLKQQYTTQCLVDAGLVIENDAKRLYDRFRGRLIFPIRNRRGQVIGFGGRVIDHKDSPKYLNSPETAVFHKGVELYGLYELKQSVQKSAHIIVVEGYMDVISLYQSGIKSAVATMGTALTKRHAEILFRETSEIILCFDGDKAGQNAAIRAFEVILPLLNQHRRARFLTLPEKEDPDTYVKRVGVEVFNETLTRAPNTAEFFLMHLLKDKDLDNADDLAKLLDEAKTVLADMAENSYVSSIVHMLANHLNISMAQLHKMLHIKKTKAKQVNFAPWQMNIDKLSLVEKALAYLLSAPAEIASAIEVRNIDFVCISQQHFILLDALKIIRQNKGLNSAIMAQILSERYSEFKPYFYQLVRLSVDLDVSLVVEEFIAMLDRVITQASHNELEQLINKAKTTVLTKAEKQRLQEILHKRQKTQLNS